jgi:hypothetical protein
MGAVYDNHALCTNGFEIAESRVIMYFALDADFDPAVDTQAKTNIEQNNTKITLHILFIFSSI